MELHGGRPVRHVMRGDGEVNGDQERYVDKINKLLRKAESTTPEEAEALTAKAQELMATYAITMAMLADREDKPKEELVEETVTFTGTYQKALKKIAFAVMAANECEGFYRNHDWQSPPYQEVVICGFESDVERVKMLVASLQIQCVSAMQTWWKERRDEVSWMSAGEKWRDRREFIFGFAAGLGLKLKKAKAEGAKEAAQEEAERMGGVSENLAEATESVALVVRKRADQVKDWYDEKHGKSVRFISDRYTPGTQTGKAAGLTAGMSANTSTGTNALRGRGELGSGS